MGESLVVDLVLNMGVAVLIYARLMADSLTGVCGVLVQSHAGEARREDIDFVTNQNLSMVVVIVQVYMKKQGNAMIIPVPLTVVLMNGLHGRFVQHHAEEDLKLEKGHVQCRLHYMGGKIVQAYLKKRIVVTSLHVQ